ncbi:hypothetical protein WM40_24375 [Robbsia andropogonis]|uniref:Uncharacterized protein n=1 Tax=Robbsia andropogonis TaxID=28092 RepID=A0A0F5JTS5_9BURK|nr:hypothetical protein WM40_24375 [Robbsia andropogonis]
MAGWSLAWEEDNLLHCKSFSHCEKRSRNLKIVVALSAGASYNPHRLSAFRAGARVVRIGMAYAVASVCRVAGSVLRPVGRDAILRRQPCPQCQRK